MADGYRGGQNRPGFSTGYGGASFAGVTPPEFYEQYNLSKRFGYTPSIVNMLGGVSSMDSYTPLGAAEYTFAGYGDYLRRATGESIQQLVDYLYRTADRFGIDRDKAYRQIERESNFNPRAVGRETRYGKAAGIAQFIESTARQYGLKDRFDPYASFDAWGLYMNDLLEMFGGDFAKAAAAYNWGQGNVAKAVREYGEGWLTRAPKETRDYVAAVVGGNGGGGWLDWIQGGGWYGGGSGSNGSKCGTFDFGCQAEEFLTGETAKDIGKRVALVLVAVILIVAAIISLR